MKWLFVLLLLVVVVVVVLTERRCAGRKKVRQTCMVVIVRRRLAAKVHNDHTCHNLPPSEIDGGLFLAIFTGSEGGYLFHRIG